MNRKRFGEVRPSAVVAHHIPPELEAVLRRDVPEAQIVHVDDGAVSRPDQTAEVVRSITRC